MTEALTRMFRLIIFILIVRLKIKKIQFTGSVKHYGTCLKKKSSNRTFDVVIACNECDCKLSGCLLG